MKIINITKQPEYKDVAIAYFQEKWANQNSMMVYEDCISRSIHTSSPLPRWYLLEHDEKIIACAGLITNDFISCGDLWPWLCTLFVEEAHRGKSLGNLLISQIKSDAASAGYHKLYLSTDHIGYYEKYGFSFLCMGYHPWGESSRVYECPLSEEKA